MIGSTHVSIYCLKKGRLYIKKSFFHSKSVPQAPQLGGYTAFLGSVSEMGG